MIDEPSDKIMSFFLAPIAMNILPEDNSKTHYILPRQSTKIYRIKSKLIIVSY